jgi:hypothetical protein
VKQENIFRLSITIYADEFESEIFFDFEDEKKTATSDASSLNSSAEEAFTSNALFSAKNMFDDEQFVNFSQDASQDSFLISNILRTENHRKNIKDNSKSSNTQIQREMIETQESSKFDDV